MKWLLGPGAHELLTPLYHHDVLAARIDTPEQAWAYHQDLPSPEGIWLIAHQAQLQAYCQPPWSGLYRLVALVDEPPSPELIQHCHLMVGRTIDSQRLAQLCAALAWPGQQTRNGTLVSTHPGAVDWRGEGRAPSALHRHTQGTPVPVLTQSHHRWPAAQWWDQKTSPGPCPLLIEDSWLCNRTALDALAHVRLTGALQTEVSHEKTMSAE